MDSILANTNSTATKVAMALIATASIFLVTFLIVTANVSPASATSPSASLTAHTASAAGGADME